MKLSDVIALIGAGYTKEEIEAFDVQDGGSAADQSAPAAEPETPPAAAPAAETPKQDNAELLAAINGLKEAIQLNNIRHSKQPETGAKDVAEAADEALMNVLNL